MLLETRTGTGDDIIAQGNAEAAAKRIAQNCASIDPRLAAARVHTTKKGSMVVYGQYDDPSSSAARSDLAWIKELTVNGRKVFPRAMLSRINPRHARGEFKPNELLSVRKQYPTINPLWTLQVAAWGDFGAGEFSLSEVKQNAEAYTRELRAAGYDAYFLHDEDQMLSIVTVGLFDKDGYDPQSTLMSAELRRLLKQFPAHLVNGEEFSIPIDQRRPELGAVIKTPWLVMVPEL